MPGSSYCHRGAAGDDDDDDNDDDNDDDDDGGDDDGEDGQDDDDNDVCDQMGVGLLALLAISCASVETLPESLLPASVTSVPPVPVLVPVSVSPVIVQILVCISTSVICHLSATKVQVAIHGPRY